MRTTRVAVDVFLLMMSWALTALGVVLLVKGEGIERLLGAAGVAFFGIGGTAYFTFSRHRDEVALRAQTVPIEGRQVRALVVPVPRTKWATVLVSEFAVAIVVILMAVVAPTAGDRAVLAQVLGYGGGALFLLLGLGGLISLRHGAPRLALLESGVQMQGISSSFVPWDAIAEVGLYEMGARQRATALRLTDPALVRRPPGSRLLSMGTRQLSGWDVTYPSAMFDLTADELVLLIRALWQRPHLRTLAASLPDADMSFAELAAAHLDIRGDDPACPR